MPTVPKTQPEPSVPKAPRGRRLTARDAVKVVATAVVLLVLFEGTSLRHAGEEMQPGWERSVVLAVGKPVGWVTDRLPLHKVDLFGWVSPGTGGTGAGGSGRHTLLVTGDSMAMPLDVEMARRLAGKGFRVVRDVHVGTGISKSLFVDWRDLSTRQVRKDRPDAVVVFIGANEGFPMPGPGGQEVECCGSAWRHVYATRVGRVLANYRQRGGAHVYWLELPLPRQGDRQEIAHAVNSSIEAASARYRSDVRVLDMAKAFTPGGRYRDSMDVKGQKRLVRDPDGIHLNETGAGVAADQVVAAVRRDFGR
jgi:lysophospholipase L1-like esterase